MSYERIIGSSSFNFEPIEQSKAEAVIAGVEAFIRTHGKSHRELADLAKVDPAAFTLFMQRKFAGEWRSIAVAVDETLARLSERMDRDARMPVMTPIVKSVLGMVRLLCEDGGLGLVQGDSGTGKTESIKAVALKYDRAIVVQASTARARPKPMLEDIGSRMGISYYARDTADTYRYVRDRLPAYDLLIIDEVHKYIGKPDCLNVLTDLEKETGVPQLWTATGDLLRYLDRKTVSWRDPFAQIRSRLGHKIDLAGLGNAGVIRPDEVRELAKRKFELKLDAAAARELCGLSSLDNEGSLRLVENTLKHARRLVTAGKLETVTADLIQRSMDRSLSKRTRERVRQLATKQAHTASPAAAAQEAIRATA